MNKRFKLAMTMTMSLVTILIMYCIFIIIPDNIRNDGWWSTVDVNKIYRYFVYFAIIYAAGFSILYWVSYFKHKKEDLISVPYSFSDEWVEALINKMAQMGYVIMKDLSVSEKYEIGKIHEKELLEIIRTPGRMITSNSDAKEQLAIKIANRYFHIVRSDELCVFWIYDESFQKINDGTFDNSITTITDAVIELIYWLTTSNDDAKILRRSKIKIREKGLIKRDSNVEIMDPDILLENIEKSKHEGGN